MRVHRLLGVGTARTRFDVSRSRGLTRFVGRDADMATLEAALEQAQAGHGQVVGVVAEAGTGKSRLCFEFAERCRARGMTVNEGHAVAHGKNIPYLPMLQVFRGYYGITERDDDRTVREKIAGRMLLLDESLPRGAAGAVRVLRRAGPGSAGAAYGSGGQATPDLRRAAPAGAGRRSARRRRSS